jgi:hypothetical protein
MTILNRYTTTILLSLTLIASQAFAVNTLGANQVTANIATTPAVQATTTLGPLTITSKVGTVGGWKGEKVDVGHQQPLLTSADGNNTLGFNIANIVSPHTCDASYSHSRLEFSYICHRNNDNPITYNSVAKDLIASNLFQSVTGGSEISSNLISPKCINRKRLRSE